MSGDLPSGGLFSEPIIGVPAPRGLGRMQVGGGDAVNRQPNDFYPTPPDVTRAFLRVERLFLSAAAPGPVWEPCGRGGAILRELAAAGFDIVGSDVVGDPDNAVTQLDLLQCRRALGRKVVTNPPFALAGDMIGHLLERLQVDYLALLLKSQFWHAEERRALFRRHRPARIWALTWRPDFMNRGAPTMDCIWVVWQRGVIGTAFNLLPRSAETQRELL